MVVIIIIITTEIIKFSSIMKPLASQPTACE